MKTALYNQHHHLGAQFVNFGGWEMPLQYNGIIQEHHAVRKQAGIFDVSHMGRIEVQGKGAESFLEYISTNKIAGREAGTVTYTVMCNDSGGAIDDALIYRFNAEHFFIVANAANREKDLAHLQKYSSSFDVSITPHFQEGILALQGPKSKDILLRIFPQCDQLKKSMRFMQTDYSGAQILISTTGYTGEHGYEIYVPSFLVPSLWSFLLTKGKPYGLQPVGLGARNTLRLEMGFALYGHELSDTIKPTESIASWSVKLDKVDFLGKDALLKPKHSFAYGVILQEPGIIRDGYSVWIENLLIGMITSGGYSPTLDQSIGLALTKRPLQIDQDVYVQIRNRFCHAKVVPTPFI